MFTLSQIMSKNTDVRVVGAELYFLPVTTRVPLKFGPETLTSVTCARVRLRVCDAGGRMAEGWGETPLSVQWVWPGNLSYVERHERLKCFCHQLTVAWASWGLAGHPLEVGLDFQTECLQSLWRAENQGIEPERAMPWLAALVCCSAFDLALHDAYGRLHQRDIYDLYGADFMTRDLGDFLQPSQDSQFCFKGKYPSEFLIHPASKTLPAWHLVGGLDPLSASELTGNEPSDGHPILLEDWIERDGLTCLKIKLRGTDSGWDWDRLERVGEIAVRRQIRWLTADFNCTVIDPEYVNALLDRLRMDLPAVSSRILYVEQPFPYELSEHPIDVHSVSERKPLFLDESAHDWRQVRLGRSLGWTGVALKTCKTQSGAILSACWAKAHGMALMVQDLTNPMLAQIPHVRLAAHVGTIMGVETNAMQFYPEASRPESLVHPGLYQRRGGVVDLGSLGGSGFGYREDEIERELPAPAAVAGD